MSVDLWAQHSIDGGVKVSFVYDGDHGVDVLEEGVHQLFVGSCWGDETKERC